MATGVAFDLAYGVVVADDVVDMLDAFFNVVGVELTDRSGVAFAVSVRVLAGVKNDLLCMSSALPSDIIS